MRSLRTARSLTSRNMSSAPPTPLFMPIYYLGSFAASQERQAGLGGSVRRMLSTPTSTHPLSFYGLVVQNWFPRKPMIESANQPEKKSGSAARHDERVPNDGRLETGSLIGKSPSTS